ncbi:MAG: septum formation initiator family protein [Vicinamibacterales bacterium]
MPMSTRDERTNPRVPSRRRETPWLRRTLVFTTCVLLAHALFGDRGLADTMRARKDYRVAESRVRRLRHDNAGLREQVRRLQNEPGEIEDVARRELGLIHPDEVLVVVTDVR